MIYLDHNSTTKMEHSVSKAMLLFFSEDHFGNPSSIHQFGRKIKTALDESRETLARFFDIPDAEEICFTSGGTEAINMAIKGAFFQAKNNFKRFHLITNQVEHEATLQAADFVESQGARVHRLAVDRSSQLDLGALESQLQQLAQDKNNQIMLSQMGANNESGILFPYEAIGSLAKKYGALYHLDAIQLPGKVEGFSVANSQADLVSLSAHKIGGPKGMGALVVRRGVKLVSLLGGGAQERKRRAGTENVAGIVGFAKATEVVRARDLPAIRARRLAMEQEVLGQIEGCHLVGRDVDRIANTSYFVFENTPGDSLIMNLDLAGFAVSSGSACHSGSLNPSHVLLAMGFDEELAKNGLRVSIGPETTSAELAQFSEVLVASVARIRERSQRFSKFSRVSLEDRLKTNQ